MLELPHTYYTLSRKKIRKLLRLQGAFEIIIFIWARRTMLVQKFGGARFLIDTLELKISMKTCFCDDHLPYAYL